MSELLQVPDQLYCVLLALRDDTLVLPNALIAEASAQDSLELRDDGTDRWLAGQVRWRNQRLPAVNFETLNGGLAAPVSRRSRMVVLHALGERPEDRPWALVCQGYPHLVTLSRVALAPLPLRESDHPEYVLARVRIGNSEALIPDLDRISELVRVAPAA
jgi:chemotaxis signal transduction protein